MNRREISTSRDAGNPPKRISQRATISGTASYFQNHSVRDDYIKRTYQGLHLSSIGVGMYKGEESDRGDQLWYESLTYALSHGVNVIDTALKYRQMRSERVLGHVVQDCIRKGTIKREEIFISTKGGLLPISPDGDASVEADEKLVRGLGVPRETIWACRHCIHPRYISWAIDKSRENMNVETIDCYFLHNPEHAALLPNPPSYHSVFECLEQARSDGKIALFGIASWNGFRRRPSSTVHLSLEELITSAEEVGGKDHGFRWLEIPLSVGMPFAAVETVIPMEKGQGTVLEAAREAKLNLFTSASLYEGKIPELLTLQRLIRIAGSMDSDQEDHPARASIPQSENSIAQLFDVLLSLRQSPEDLQTLLSISRSSTQNFFVAALDVVRSLPEVTSSLVGMEKQIYVRELLHLSGTPRVDPVALAAFWKKLRHGSGSHGHHDGR